MKGSKFRKWSPDEVWEDSHLILFFWASLQYWDFLLLSNFDKNIEEKCYKLRWPKTKIQFPLILESSVSEQEEADQLMRMCLTGLDTLMIQSHFRSTRGRSSSAWDVSSREAPRWVRESWRRWWNRDVFSGSRDLLHHPLYRHLQESWSQNGQLWRSPSGGQTLKLSLT